MPLTIPPDLSAPIQDGFRHYRDAPATRRFLKLARSGAKWSPDWPRRLVRLAAERKVTVEAPQYFDLLSAGFRGPDRAWRIVQALAVILRAWRLKGRPGYIYEDRDLLVFGDGAPRSWPAPESALRTTWHTSPAGPPPAVDVDACRARQHTGEATSRNDRRAVSRNVARTPAGQESSRVIFV